MILALLLAAALSAAAESGEVRKSPDPRYTIGELLFADDFTHGTGNWFAELEQGGTVKTVDGTLTIDVPAGLTLWFKPRIEGAVLIEYEATVVSGGGPNDRTSDLNCFWMARDSRSPDDIFGFRRRGKFSEYNALLTYYVGLGGNNNTTTRFRRYVGDPTLRPLLPEDNHQAREDLLTANASQHIQLVACGQLIQFHRDGRRLFERSDPEPYTSGWFAFRTVASHEAIRNFRVYRLHPTNASTTPPARK